MILSLDNVFPIAQMFLSGVLVATTGISVKLFMNKDTEFSQIEDKFLYALEGAHFYTKMIDNSINYTKIVKSTKTSYGWEFELKFPAGKSLADFLLIKEAIELYTNTAIDAYTKNGKILLKIYTNELPDYLPLIPTERRLLCNGFNSTSRN